MAEPYVEQVEYLDVLTKIGKKIGKKIGGSKPRHVPSFLGDVHRDGDYHKAVQSGFLLRAHKNYFSKNVQTARTRGQGCGISPVLAIYLLACMDLLQNPYSEVYQYSSQDTEVSDVKYISFGEYRSHLAEADPKYVPYDVNKQYGLLFDIITKRYKENNEARSLILQKQLRRYAPVSLTAEVVNFLQF
ncbi:hypothetical protein GOBAR_DD06485 [Gossypium barbadense]|nr:hypothetical protein GOBAR_DD06485 [Gossypium barbadense]